MSRNKPIDQKQMGEHTDICIIGLTAYPVLTGKNIKRIIGPDIHTTLLARELSKHKFRVSFITYNEGGPDIEYIYGLKVIKTYNFESNINIIIKIISIWNAMRRADADIYYYHGGADGICSFFAKVLNKKFVWHIAHDRFVTRDPRDFSIIGRIGSWIDLKLADVIVVQSEFQKMVLKDKFIKDGILIKNHYLLCPQESPKKANPPVLLWVGTMANTKRPDLFLEVAKALPDIKFKMIGGPSTDSTLYNSIKYQSRHISNLDFLGFMPERDIYTHFKEASILINTADSEGFPYAFIQAWMNYTPVVSLNSDPDEIICKQKLGLHSKTLEQMILDIKLLLKNESQRDEFGKNGRRYVENEHDLKKIINEHINIFNNYL